MYALIDLLWPAPAEEGVKMIRNKGDIPKDQGSKWWTNKSSPSFTAAIVLPHLRGLSWFIRVFSSSNSPLRFNFLARYKSLDSTFNYLPKRGLRHSSFLVIDLVNLQMPSTVHDYFLSLFIMSFCNLNPSKQFSVRESLVLPLLVCIFETSWMFPFSPRAFINIFSYVLSIC
jgi:hypothetical protein